MTWGELKRITLQKLFFNTDEPGTEEETIRDYVSAMPAAANEALHLLAGTGRFIQKTATISQGGGYDTPQRYNMDKLRPDFFSFDENQIYQMLDDGTVRRIKNFRIEGDSVLLLDPDLTGDIIVYYNAYPPLITGATPDDAELCVRQELAVLLPLYMASQLYRDDEPGIAAQYRNEFEAARDALRTASMRVAYGRESFESENGWW